jgi:hypothetical protein
LLCQEDEVVIRWTGRGLVVATGPLVSPAPGIAGGLPRRFGSISQEGAGPVVAVLRQRFGAPGAGLIADARQAAAAARGDRPVTAAWPSGLYGQPRHIDPVTRRPAWVMYLGLDAPPSWAFHKTWSAA